MVREAEPGHSAKHDRPGADLFKPSTSQIWGKVYFSWSPSDSGVPYLGTPLRHSEVHSRCGQKVECAEYPGAIVPHSRP